MIPLASGGHTVSLEFILIVLAIIALLVFIFKWLR